MNESIKTFSLVVITICVFIMTVIDILELLEERRNRHVHATATEANQAASSPDFAPVSNQPITTIRFEETKHEFGEIRDGEVVRHRFEFTNTGLAPLVIAQAKGSCGCTVPTYPEEPVAPGARGFIEVQFDSKGRTGTQNKSVTVSANTNPPVTTLIISSTVLPAE